MARHHLTSYDLGQRIPIVNEAGAIELESEEAYRLHLVPQEVFKRDEQPTKREGDEPQASPLFAVE